MERARWYEPADGDQPNTVIVRLFDRHPGNPYAQRPAVRERIQSGKFLGSVEVRFDPEERDRPCGVGVMLEDGVSATTLQRLPWARVLRSAEAFRRARTEDTVDAWRAVVSALGDGDATVARVQRRRGRPRVYGPEFHKRIARRYTDLAVAGAHNPVLQIAREEHVSRNTAAGWVRKARALKLLPPGRRGKAG